MSHAVDCGHRGSAVRRETTQAKRATGECDATTQRSAVAPATETNRAPSWRAKLARRPRSDVDTRFMKATALFYGGSSTQLVVSRLLCHRPVFDSLAIIIQWNRVRVAKRYIGPKRMLVVMVRVAPPHHHQGAVLELVCE